MKSGSIVEKMIGGGQRIEVTEEKSNEKLFWVGMYPVMSGRGWGSLSSGWHTHTHVQENVLHPGSTGSLKATEVISSKTNISVWTIRGALVCSVFQQRDKWKKKKKRKVFNQVQKTRASGGRNVQKIKGRWGTGRRKGHICHSGSYLYDKTKHYRQLQRHQGLSLNKNLMFKCNLPFKIKSLVIPHSEGCEGPGWNVRGVAGGLFGPSIWQNNLQIIE